MTLSELVTLAFLIGGAFFFLAGTVGVIRFPDALVRLHAVTKADNLGLGLVVTGLAVHSGSLSAALKLFLIWLLVLVASGTSAYLIGQAADRSGDAP